MTRPEQVSATLFIFSSRWRDEQKDNKESESKKRTDGRSQLYLCFRMEPSLSHQHTHTHTPTHTHTHTHTPTHTHTHTHTHSSMTPRPQSFPHRVVISTLIKQVREPASPELTHF